MLIVWDMTEGVNVAYNENANMRERPYENGIDLYVELTNIIMYCYFLFSVCTVIFFIVHCDRSYCMSIDT